MSRAYPIVRDPKSRILLVAEGGFPWVTGGVATWMRGLIHGLDSYDFQIANVGRAAAHPAAALPGNLQLLPAIDLTQSLTKPNWVLPPPHNHLDAAAIRKSLLEDPEPSSPSPLLCMMDEPLPKKALHELLYSKEAWDLLATCFAESPVESLADFVWTSRFFLACIYKAQILAASLPTFDVAHGTTTGYAGLVAAAAAGHQSKPLIITEHADYVSEKALRFSLEQADESACTWGGSVQTLWLRLLRHLKLALYQKCDALTSLFPSYAQKQHTLGALPSKSHTIANGVRAASPRPKISSSRPFRVAYLGRVSAEKNLHLLIRAFARVQDTFPDSELSVLGPKENVTYAASCTALAAELGVAAQTHFPGEVDVAEHLASIDVVVLSSLSEGQPYALLEAMAHGVPVVAPDLGDCYDMIAGRTKCQGTPFCAAAGIVVESVSEASLACAILETKRRQAEFSKAGPTRVKNHYDFESTIQGFARLYRDAEAL